MRVALLYPPPWKIALPGDAPYPRGEGPPKDHREGDLDPDFWQAPYGLLSLAAQAIAAGHQVKVLNLSSYAWPRVQEVLRGLEADLWALSCWTANRRGVAFVAQAIKQAHPGTHVLVGGPHATPFAEELLAHHEHIDTVSVGESEEQFLELCARIEAGASLGAIAGTVYRDRGAVRRGPARAAIHDLDTLESVHAHFDTHIVMTSRGCPWACTFCGAENTWGRGFRGQSVAYTLDALERALERAPVRMLQIKDDTFTTNKKRVLELCRGIRERQLRFLWSCDTRVDVLDETLLREMRLAGCQRLSLGVESGSPSILRAVDKKITVEKILASADLAKKYGVKLRFYMMLGTRGETAETFRETLQFLERARPHQYLFSCLSIYPGTRDFQEAEAAGTVKREWFFTDDFQELKMPFDAPPELARTMNDWFAKNKGLRTAYEETADECRAVLARLDDHPPAHLDVAGACHREGDLEGTEHHAKRALELGHPCPGLAHNYLACVAATRRDLDAVQEHLRIALRTDPRHFVVAQNAEALRVWLGAGGPIQNLPLNLVGRHDFQIFERTVQPALPGPLADDWAEWPPPAPPRPRAEGSPSREPSTRRLDVVE